MDLVTTTDLGAHNARRLADAIVDSGAISRAQLSRDTGLSKPTVSIALARLERVPVLVREVGRTQRPPGGDRAALRPGARRRDRAWRSTSAGAWSGPASPTWPAGALADHRRAHPAAPARPRSATSWWTCRGRAGGGAGGPRRAPGRRHARRPGRAGRRRATACGWRRSLPGLQAREPWRRLHQALGVDIHVANDVNLAATAELALGRGRPTPATSPILSIGTGVGLALVLDGRLRSGAHRSAGEVGYLPMPAPPAPTPGGAVRAGKQGPCSRPRGRRRRPGPRSQGPLGLRVAPRRRWWSWPAAGDATALGVLRRAGRRCSPSASSPSAPSSTPGSSCSAAVWGRCGADVLLPLLHKALRRLSPLRPTLVVSELGDHAVLDGAVVYAVATARRPSWAPVQLGPHSPSVADSHGGL